MDTVITGVVFVIVVGVPILGVLIEMARRGRAKWRDFNALSDAMVDRDRAGRAISQGYVSAYVERPTTCSYCRKYLYHHRTDGPVKGSVDLRASNIDIAESQRLQHITCRCGWTDGGLSILHPDDIAALEAHSELWRALEKGDAPAAVNAYSDLKRLLGDTSPVVNAYSGLEQVKRMLA